MRFLFRLLASNPALAFTVLALLALGLAIVAFVWSEKRARALAALADDPEMASGQRRRLLVIGVVTVAVLALGGWWSFLRVHTQPRRVLIAIAIDSGEGGELRHWWQGDPGAEALAKALAAELETVGLQSVEFGEEQRTILDEAGTHDEIAAAARRLEARWVVEGRVEVDKTIPLQLADFSDYILTVDLELVDALSGERHGVPGTPLRAFLWGESPSEAAQLNAEYLADRVTMPLIAVFAEREPLRALQGDPSTMNNDDALVAAKLEPLFRRSSNYARGLELREQDHKAALASESTSPGAHRLGGILDEEYFIGTAADGRVALLSDPKYISVIPGELGYAISSEGEALVLADRDGGSRELLFEHYNFYSAPEVSPDGRVVWTTVANHGASKSLATIDVASGEFRPVISHPTDYYTSPIPAPDGSRALFYSRPGRYAKTSIELIDASGENRKLLVHADELGGMPQWDPSGRRIYVPIGAWQRIVAIDIETGERRHVIGQDPDAEPEPEPDPDSDPGPLPPPPPDPRTGPDLAHHGAQPGGPPLEPSRHSRFVAVAVGPEGRYLFLIEESLDGRDWIGRLDLQAPPPPEPDPDSESESESDSEFDSDKAPIAAPPSPYERLAKLEARRVIASPTEARVAVEVPAFTTKGDPEPNDAEVIVIGPGPELEAVTLNDYDDELAGWSRDGESVFTIQRRRDPGDAHVPVVRVYRHDLQ